MPLDKAWDYKHNPFYSPEFRLKLEEIEIEGQQAFFEKLPLSASPFTRGLLREVWQCGWVASFVSFVFRDKPPPKREAYEKAKQAQIAFARQSLR